MPQPVSSRPSLAASCYLWDLSPGLYHLYPDSPDVVQRLRRALERRGRSCLVFPFDMSSFLVADSVRRETAFDLENQGLTDDQLNIEVDRIIRDSPFANRRHQAPVTLSGGEQQQLAVTAALQQPHEFLIGQHCFDFLSPRNMQIMHDHLAAHGKRMLDITYRNGGLRQDQSTWRLNGDHLKALAAARWESESPAWLSTIPPWRLVAQEVEKRFVDTAFNLWIPHLVLDRVRCLGISGDNGSGKSTLADCLTGLLPYKGRLQVELPGVDAPRLGYLMQQGGTTTQGLTTADIVQRFVRQGRLTEAQGESLIRTLEEARYYRPLAGLDARIGYRLVIIAALLSGDYDLVILDEPTYGLPVQGVAEFLVQIAGELGAKPLAIISHDRNFLSLFCDTIVHLDNGAVHEANIGSHLYR